MPRRHHRNATIPFWCKFLLSTWLALLSAGCGSASDEAMRKAAEAQQAFEAGNLTVARTAIAEATAARDDVVDYQLLRGRIELAAGSPGAAFDAYNNALALDAANGEALLAVAQLGLSTGNLRDSLQAAERISALAPDQPDALLVRGIHALVRRHYTEAIAFAEQILARDPTHEGGTILKARALFMAGKPIDALAALDRLPPNLAGSEAIGLTKLEIYRAQRRPAEMGAVFDQLRSQRPDDLALRLDEANLRFKRNQRELAHARVTEVLASPKVSAQLAGQALDLWREYGGDDVPPATKRALAARASAPAKRALARFYIAQGRTGPAAAVLASLSDPQAAGLRARLLLAEGRPGAAEEQARAVLARDATDCDALIAASAAALRRSDTAAALPLAQRAAAECPLIEDAWLASAEAYARAGHDGGVERVYAQGLDANKQSPELTRAYTKWLEARGRKREALAIARRLTRYAPALPSGWRLYEGLCHAYDPSCVGEAQRGAADAATVFAIDPAPGTRAPNGLFGRLVQR